MSEQPSVEAQEFDLADELRIGACVLPERGSARQQMLRWAERADALTAALERAERERDAALDQQDEANQEFKRVWGEKIAAEARAQKAEAERDEARLLGAVAVRGFEKAEAVVEAARSHLRWGCFRRNDLDAAITAYDEPPTGQA